MAKLTGMNHPAQSLLLVALPFLFVAAPAMGAITLRDSKGGKVLLVVDDETVRTAPDAKPVLFIDGPKVSKEKGGPAFLFVPSDICYAYQYDGEVIGYADGRQMRDKPGGKETLYVSDPDIRDPDVHGKPLYWLDNHEVLNRAQLFAAIYTLRPELFKMPAAPAAAAGAAAAPAAAMGGKIEPGTYSVTGGALAGKVTIAKAGDVFAMSFAPTAGEAMGGVGIVQNGELWAAVGPPAATGLALYAIDGGTLKGEWLNAGGDKATFGSETAVGNATLGGAYQISAAKAPVTGAAYGGTLTIDPVSGTTLGDAPVYTLNWDLGGGYKIAGVGFKAGNQLAATSGACTIVRFKVGADGTLTGDSVNAAKATGTYTLKRD